jgi:hypothetical protein
MLVGASGALTPAETSRLCPFDLTAAVPPEQVDLDAVTVEQFSLPRKYARPLARQGLEAAEAETCEGRYVPGRARNVHVNVRIQSMSSEPVLLPVWIMAYRFREKLYRFLVNGQSGRSTGEAPLSWTKILVVAGIVLLVALLVLAFASGAMGAGLGTGEPSYEWATPRSASLSTLVAALCSTRLANRKPGMRVVTNGQTLPSEIQFGP